MSAFLPVSIITSTCSRSNNLNIVAHCKLTLGIIFQRSRSQKGFGIIVFLFLAAEAFKVYTDLTVEPLR